MALLEKYRALVDHGVIAPDPAQSIAAARLDGLAGRLRKWKRRTGLAALLRGKEPAPKGLYIFGAVGRGKTMLMDLFFQTTTFRPKRRMHFHEFMAEVHDRIAAARKDVHRAIRSRAWRASWLPSRHCCASTRCTSPTSPTP